MNVEFIPKSSHKQTNADVQKVDQTTTTSQAFQKKI